MNETIAHLIHFLHLSQMNPEPSSLYGWRVLPYLNSLTFERLEPLNTSDILKIRTELRKLGVPTKSIPILKAILDRPGMTNTELGAATNMTKQAVSKHVNPLEQKGIIINKHKTPLWKEWELADDNVRTLIKQLSPQKEN